MPGNPSPETEGPMAISQKQFFTWLQKSELHIQSDTQENVNFNHQKLIWDKKYFQLLHKRWFCLQILPRQGTILEAESMTSSSTSVMN